MLQLHIQVYYYYYYYRIKNQAIILGNYFTWSYFLNAERTGGTSRVAKMYTNNVITANEREVLRSPFFNRKFLPEEIEQFLHNEKVQTKGRKRYTYNKAIHGNDENAFKEKFERMNSGRHYLNDDMLNKIKENNKTKTDNKEVVRLVPWNAARSMDLSGDKYHD